MIVIKIIISILIVALTAYIGSSKSRKLKEREYVLREMVTFLKLVENEIKYMMNILPNAYEIARQKLNTELKIKIGQIVVDMLDSNNMTYIEGSIEKNISEIERVIEGYNILKSDIANNKNISDADIDSYKARILTLLNKVGITVDGATIDHILGKNREVNLKDLIVNNKSRVTLDYLFNGTLNTLTGKNLKKNQFLEQQYHLYIVMNVK